MSDDSVDDFAKRMEQEAQLDKLKKETSAKEAVLRAKRVNAQMEQSEQDEQNLGKIKLSDLSKLSDERINDLVSSNESYFAACKESMTFINKEFKNVVPFFRKNLITIFGQTGEGKSTVVSNVVYSALQQKVNGRHAKILVLSNEERAEDVYNRVVCISKGWHYVAHDKLTTEQQQTISKGLRALAASGRLTTISDDHFGPAGGATTTLEGIQRIFENLIATGTHYDAILIDYYQKIDASTENRFLKEHEVQSKLMTMLDQYKNVYPAPIVLMAQIRPIDKQNTPVEYRIKGSKQIIVKSTCVLEMTKDAANLRTLWTLHKGRFTEFLGEGFFTVYDQGKFVENTTENQQKVSALVRSKSFASFDKKNGIKSEDKENKE